MLFYKNYIYVIKILVKIFNTYNVLKGLAFFIIALKINKPSLFYYVERNLNFYFITFLLF